MSNGVDLYCQTSQTRLMVQKIAVANQKGGVGKTTVATNVGAELVAGGEDTLLIDLDPHGAATEAVGLDDRYDDEPPTLHDVLVDRTAGLDALIAETDWMDVVPANIDMTMTEDLLTAKPRSRERLNDALEGLDRGYDVIVVDCPPNLGHLTDNALVACQDVLVPALAESPSIRSIDLLFDQMEVIGREFQTSTSPVGIVANRVENTNQADRMIDRFEDYGVPVWQVRKRVALQRAYEAGEPLLAYDEGNDMNEVFRSIASHLADLKRPEYGADVIEEGWTRDD